MKKLLALILCGLMVLSFSGYAEEGVQDGAYNVVGPGFYGDLDVTVTIADGRIADITVANCPETPELGGRAIEIMTAAMVENNTSGVDSVTGATVTSAFFRRAVNEALKQANAPNAMKAHVEAPEKTAETLDCDVLVMGSGTAGLSAAIAAAEAGASVLVIEKQDIPGGSAVTSAGIVYAPVDEADRDAMVQYYMDRAEGNANQELLQFYADNALDTISWLESLGVQWLMTVPAGTAPEPRARFSMTAEGVGMTGAALVNPMLAKLNALGVQLLCGVKGTELLVDESGAIIGAKAESKAADYTINANSVILATGGFDASKEMKAAYSPVAEDDFPLSAKGNVGDGINMGMAIGAATEFKGGVIGFDFVDGSLPASGMNAVAMYCSSYVQPDGTFVQVDYAPHRNNYRLPPSHRLNVGINQTCAPLAQATAMCMRMRPRSSGARSSLPCARSWHWRRQKAWHLRNQTFLPMQRSSGRSIPPRHPPWDRTASIATEPKWTSSRARS